MTLDQLPEGPGHYRVTTRSGSTYLFDLVERTVTRHPGKNSRPNFTDGQHALLRIIQGEVGISGFWTMEADTPELTELFEYLWQVTSPIVSIEEVEGTNEIEDG